VTGRVIVNDQVELPEVWLADGVIAPEPPGRPADITLDGVALPGLVDVHCHIGLGAEGAVDPGTARAQAIADRDTGVLLIRDAGCPRRPYSTRWMDQDPALPRLIRCGRHLARVKRYIRPLPREVEPDELPAAVEREAKAGDGWVKLVGDWIDRDLAVPDLAPLWPDQALSQAVARAHALGARVTTHVFSREAAAQALRCGVDCLEHGTGLDAGLMAQAVTQGVAVVPTMLQRVNFGDIAASGRARYRVWADHLQRLYEARFSQALELHQAGVLWLVGTDESTQIPHGQYGLELGLLAQAGIPAPAIVAAASYRTRAYLGVPGIEPGASADLVVYPTDPRDGIGVMGRPLAVVLRGTVVAGEAL
jgi:imidazolonepropionase-like amidohydrolase